MEKKKLSKLINRYISGEATVEEQKIVNDWLDAIGNQTDQAIDITRARKSLARRRLLDQLDQRTVKRFPSRNWKIAAAVIPLFGIGIVFWLMTFFNTPITNLMASTGVGEFKELTLPDGTIVTLKPNTKLYYPEKFGESREVKLEGNAFFDVFKDPTKPFSIHFEETSIEVIGTSFEIIGYKEALEQQVTVASGIVSVKYKEGQKTFLTKSDQWKVNKQTGEIKKRKVEQVEGLDQARAIFEEASMDQVVTILSNYFGASIEISKELDISLSANLDATLPQAIVIDAIGELLKNNQYELIKTNADHYVIR
ncbi:FecR family protein [Belliella kenyensis]|uniref:FecR family protein n=1 Tax=Belliella kenyensis TaxID=1472724 RepID=A0ABV8EQ35_9BACT|nr:FecR domain-containing protein [Belliella kenyensis]MCH7400722.1 FecR domain-containing protein [Belliella kenyensis]MDN3601991.1 FecR domain-containing protein [Belliella kenyensis]